MKKGIRKALLIPEIPFILIKGPGSNWLHLFSILDSLLHQNIDYEHLQLERSILFKKGIKHRFEVELFPRIKILN